MTSVLFTHATVLTMDPSQPLLKNAFVSVDGPKITFLGQQRPFGCYDREIDCTGNRFYDEATYYHKQHMKLQDSQTHSVQHMVAHSEAEMRNVTVRNL